MNTENGNAVDWSELAAQFGERFDTRAAVREHHGRAETFYPMLPPDAVVFPRTTEEVAAAVRFCAARNIPIVPYGVGTSLEGNFLAVQGGLCIDLSQMNRIVRVSTDDLDCTVEAGVTRTQLNAALRDTGLFFPIDPGADATLGGMASTRASGTNAVRYGTMRGNVLGLTVVLADGRVIHTGSRARKSAAGYDLTALFVGAEGTLGVITEVSLRLYGQPEAIAAGVCGFATLRGAVDTVIATIQLGVPVARIELLDALQIKAINAYRDTHYPEQPTLFLEFHGTDAGVAEQLEQFAVLAADHGGGQFQSATKTEERSAMWEARHRVHYANLAMRPGSRAISTDVCVPISRLTECIEKTREAIEAFDILGPIVGHVGDGNFHVVMLIDPNSDDEMQRAKALSERIVELALACDGTCTGEHGIGIGKRNYLIAEHGEGVAVMQSLKNALDPQQIMNPGKLFFNEHDGFTHQ